MKTYDNNELIKLKNDKSIENFLSSFDKNNSQILDYNPEYSLHDILNRTKKMILDETNYKKYFNEGGKRFKNVNLLNSHRTPEISVYPYYNTENYLSRDTSHNYYLKTDTDTIISSRNFLTFSKRKYNKKTEIDNSNLENSFFEEKKKSELKNKIFKLNNNFQSISLEDLEENEIPLDKLYDLEFNMKILDIESKISKFDKNNPNLKLFLLKKIKELIEREFIENINFLKIKNLSYSLLKNKYKVNLTCKSLTLLVKNKSSHDEIILNLPFTILPLFYYISMDHFKFLISQLIKFDSEFTKIELDINSISEILKVFKNKIFNADLIDQDSNINLQIKNFIENSNNKITIITPNNLYEMTIQLPMINFSIEDEISNKKLSFEKIIEKEILLFLIQEDFKKWDTFLLNYLCISKSYRDNLIKFFNIKNSNCEQINLNNFVSKINKIESIKQKKYFESIVCYIKNGIMLNKYQKLFSYKTEININFGAKLNKKFEFDFKIDHMFKFEKIREFLSIEEFIEKCLIINSRKENVFLDLNTIDAIDDEYLKLLKVLNKKNKNFLLEENLKIMIKYYKFK